MEWRFLRIHGGAARQLCIKWRQTEDTQIHDLYQKRIIEFWEKLRETGRVFSSHQAV